MFKLIVASVIGAALASDEERQRIVDIVNNDPTSTWTAKIHPQFEGTDFDVVKAKCGALRDPNSGLRTVYHHALTELDVAALPDNFDARTNWPNCQSIKEVRDQGSCGSCWAFGAVEAASDRICIATGGQLQTRLSSNALVSCCSSCGSGCQGGYPYSAWQYLVSTGIPSGNLYGDKEWCQAYSIKPCDHHTTGTYGPCSSAEASTPKCVKSCDQGTTFSKSYQQDVSDNKFATAYYVSSAVNQIKQEIFTNGPVEAAFTVYADFETYSSGIYKHKTGSSLGGHAVKIIGWGVENNVPFWTVVNSWNEGWGEKGIFRIISGQDECGIESEIVAGLYKPKQPSASLRAATLELA